MTRYHLLQKLSAPSFILSFGFAFMLTLWAPRIFAEATSDHNDYTIHNAVIRSTPSTTTAAYMVIRNNGDIDDALVSAYARWAERIELHNVTADEKNIMKMHQVESMTLPAQGELVLKPGNFHLMIFGVKETLTTGETKNITLEFSSGKKITHDFIVQPITFQAHHTDQHHEHKNGHDHEQGHEQGHKQGHGHHNH